MFGEYAQIASYITSTRDAAQTGDSYQDLPLPTYLKPPYQPPQPWGPSKDRSGLTEDFIMIAEFSELEGPKPVLTIPKDGGKDFDQNSFSVRILAVDHQTSSEGFSISEDAQVVLSDMNTGVFSFVHHIVLYDNTARGFVRPYCIAYITTDQKKLMAFYEDLSSQFKKVSRYLKYGNMMLFVADLERHLKDLDHTKSFLLNQVSRTRLKDSYASSDSRKSTENELYKGLQNIRQSSTEIREILTTLKPLLNDKRLEAKFRTLEERAFREASHGGSDKLSLQENWFNDLASIEDMELRCGSLEEPRLSPLCLFKPRDYKPLLVETKKAKRFNSPLRGLHELCSWGAKMGLTRLRNVYESFKRDKVVMDLEKMESVLFRPRYSAVSYGQCISSNFMTGVHMDRRTLTEEDEEKVSRIYNMHWGSVGSLDSSDSFKTVNSDSSELDVGNTSVGSLYDSQSLNLYQSAPSSPDKQDFSMLQENEYYPSYGSYPEEKSKFYVSDEDCDRIESRKGTLLDSSSFNSDTEANGGAVGGDSNIPSSMNRPIGAVGGASNFPSSSSRPIYNVQKNEIKYSHCGIAPNTSVPTNAKVDTEEEEDSETDTLKTENSSNMVSQIFERFHVQDLESSKTETKNSNLHMQKPAVAQTSQGELSVHKESKLSQLINSRVNNSGLSNQSKSIQYSTHEFKNSSKSLQSSPKSIQVPLKNGRLKARLENTDLTHSSSAPRLTSYSAHVLAHKGHGSISSFSTADDINSDRLRSESDASSAFTELSIHDLFPNVNCSETASHKDTFGASNSYEVLESGELKDTSCSQVSLRWKSRCSVLTIGDWIHSNGSKRPGEHLHEVLSTYNNLQHVIYSLLTGRPVLVAGAARYEPEVVKAVNALSVFVPSIKRKRQVILEWSSKPLKITDMTRLKLLGVCRPEKKSLESAIPASIRKSSTIFDIEKKVITGPQYQGNFITSLLGRRKVLKSDAVLLVYIHWWLMDILSKAFIFFHSFCLGSAGSILYSKNPREQSEAYRSTVSGIMTRLGLKESDCDIIECVTEMLKTAKVERSVWADFDYGGPVHPLTIHHGSCHTFKC